MTHDNEYDDEEFYVSRTEQKKSMQIYMAIGEELLSLNNSQLNQIPLFKELENALTVAKKIKVGNALKRQMSYIGKLIRNNNYEDIQAALDHLKQQDNLHDHFLQLAEKWRDRLINEEPKALANFISEYPQCDRQKLNQLTRHAIKEASEKKAAEELGKKAADNTSKYKKALFKLLREIIADKGVE